MRTDYYKILGVSWTASLSEIEKAYYAQASIWHPDNFVNDSPENIAFAEARYKEICEAYRVLSDPSLREEYDQNNRIPLFDDSDKSGENNNKWGRWLSTACVVTVLFLLPKYGGSIIKEFMGESDMMDKFFQEKIRKTPTADNLERPLNIPEITIPYVDKNYSVGSSSKPLHYNNAGRPYLFNLDVPIITVPSWRDSLSYSDSLAPKYEPLNNIF